MCTQTYYTFMREWAIYDYLGSILTKKWPNKLTNQQQKIKSKNNNITIMVKEIILGTFVRKVKKNLMIVTIHIHSSKSSTNKGKQK